MNIAIIGAGGSVGMEIAQLIISERIMQYDERLILTANPEGASAKSVYGFASDLQDAYSEICPRIEVACDPEAIEADLIVMTAGSTLHFTEEGQSVNRQALAEINAPVFHLYARAIAKTGHSHEIVLCISNPNELCVAVFAKYLGRKRVIGMGAFLDSLRFRQEIAADLEIRRQLIHGFMAGEHGAHIVPLWSGVHIYGYSEQALTEAIQKIRQGYNIARFRQTVREVGVHLKTLVEDGRVREAYQMLRDYPPDVRVVLKPYVTHFSGSKTVMGTARATMEFIRTITQGSDALISGQITLDGEFYDIHGTIGVPFVVGNQGVDRVFEIPITDEEKTALIQDAEKVQKKIDPYLQEDDT